MTIENPEMAEPLQRLFEREYPVRPFIHTMSEQNNQFVVVEPRSESIHAVRIESSYTDCIFDLSAGIHAAQDYAANRRWVALPLDAFRDGEEAYNSVMLAQCTSRGVGIITVQQKGTGLSAKVILEAKLIDGKFIDEHPSIAAELANAELVEDDDGLRVVSID